MHERKVTRHWCAAVQHWMSSSVLQERHHSTEMDTCVLLYTEAGDTDLQSWDSEESSGWMLGRVSQSTGNSAKQGASEVLSHLSFCQSLNGLHIWSYNTSFEIISSASRYQLCTGAQTALSHFLSKQQQISHVKLTVTVSVQEHRNLGSLQPRDLVHIQETHLWDTQNGTTLCPYSTWTDPQLRNLIHGSRRKTKR